MNDQNSRRIINALTVLCVVGLVVAGAYAVLSVGTHEPETAMYVLGEDESGRLSAGSYPRDVPTGAQSEEPVYVGIRNHLPSESTYTVLLQLQSVTFIDNETHVDRRRNTDRFTVTVEPNRQTRQPVHLRAPFDAEYLRMVFLLYSGEVPSNPSMTNADRSTHIWLETDLGLPS